MLITAYKVGTKCFIVLKRPEPIRARTSPRFPIQFRQLLMPRRIRNFHRKLVGDLSFPIGGESFVSYLPSSFLGFRGDNADPYSRIIARSGSVFFRWILILHRSGA